MNNKRAGYLKTSIQPLTIWITSEYALALSYPEHLCAACGAHTLSRRSAILHGYALGVFHFLLGTAFDAVRLHLFKPPSLV